MGKRIVISFSLLFVFGIIALAGTIYAQTASQQVTVTVVSGFLNIYSPVEKSYQENNIVLKFNVTTPLDINSIWMTDNGKSSYLCSKCKTYDKSTYFSNGKHDIKIQVRFANRDIIEGNVSFFVDSSSSIYIQTNSGLKKATAKDISNYLQHYNFTIEHRDELAPDDACSVRAKKGNSTVNGKDFGIANNLNFYSISSIEQVRGHVILQKGLKFFDFKFGTSEIVEDSDAFLKLKVFQTKTNNTLFLELDKTNKRVTIISDNFSVANMNVYFIAGCSKRNNGFYLLINYGKVKRNKEEIRKILNENPIFTEKFEGLRFSF